MVHLGCMRQQPFELPANVAFGSNSEVAAVASQVCSTPNNRHLPLKRACPFGAKKQKWITAR
jgi:hypothetical protein